MKLQDQIEQWSDDLAALRSPAELLLIVGAAMGRGQAKEFVEFLMLNLTQIAAPARRAEARAHLEAALAAEQSAPATCPNY